MGIPHDYGKCWTAGRPEEFAAAGAQGPFWWLGMQNTDQYSTWWLISFCKCVIYIAPVINGISRVNPLMTYSWGYNPFTKWDEPPSNYLPKNLQLLTIELYETCHPCPPTTMGSGSSPLSGKVYRCLLLGGFKSLKNRRVSYDSAMIAMMVKSDSYDLWSSNLLFKTWNNKTSLWWLTSGQDLCVSDVQSHAIRKPNTNNWRYSMYIKKAYNNTTQYPLTNWDATPKYFPAVLGRYSHLIASLGN